MSRLAGRLTIDAARGEIRDQGRRYLMLRPDVLMGMLRGLDGQARQAALDALAASVARHGRDSVLAYLDQLEGDRVALLPLSISRVGIQHRRLHPRHPAAQRL
jgi:hypothetical protein